MRADRLISILMLLQSRGRMTARELAEELEVSERTIYRDVEALCAAGVPLYAEYGPGGGLALLDSYRTNLTGLTESEQRALFMLFGLTVPLEKLGVRQELKSALLKLSAALPNANRADEEKVRQRFFLDWSWWFHNQEPAPHLETIRQAVWDERRLRLFYRTFLLYPTEVEVEPYGLVAKAGIWYLVAGVAGTASRPRTARSPMTPLDAAGTASRRRNEVPQTPLDAAGARRVFQISWLTDVQPLEDHFPRPADFDLPAFWEQWCADYEQNQQAFLVTLRVSPALFRLLPLYLGRRVVESIAQAGPPDAEGWFPLTLSFETFEAARDRILGFGSAAEVLEPETLRCSLVDYAEQIVEFYEKKKWDVDERR